MSRLVFDGEETLRASFVASLVLVLAVSSASTVANAEDVAGAKNVILLIGDGFGAAQMSLALQYRRLVESSPLHLESLMEDGNSGYCLAMPYRSTVTDSAAAASQFATGEKTRNESLSLSVDGYRTETLVEWATSHGLDTGIVSNMRLSHATPAAFAAHVPSRYESEAVILDQMLVEHEVDVLLGGGARALVPSGRRVGEILPSLEGPLDGGSNRLDTRNRVEEATARGYTVVSDRASLREAAASADKLLGLFAASHLPYVVDTRAQGLESVPSLAELTSAATEVLSRADRGFFLVVEGGRIDYGGHDNDAGTMLHEILDFDAAIGTALQFQERHPDTLVLVTADHGTGGFSFSYSGFDGFPEPRSLPSGLTYEPHHYYPGREQLLLLHRQTASFVRILELAQGSPERLVEAVQEHVGIRIELEEAREALERDSEGNAWIQDLRHFYGDQDSNPACLLGRVLAPHTFVVWSTGGHTTEPVLTFGRGPSASRLRGVYENTHVHAVMKDALSRYHAN